MTSSQNSAVDFLIPTNDQGYPTVHRDGPDSFRAPASTPITLFVVYSEPSPAPLPDGFVSVDDLVSEYEKDPAMAEAISRGRMRLAQAAYGQVPRKTLAALRLARGLSQSGLARIVGTSQPRISRIETGKEVPSLVCAKAIAQALSADLDSIYEAFEASRGE